MMPAVGESVRAPAAALGCRSAFLASTAAGHPGASAGHAPPSHSQIELIAEARRRARKVHRAANVAVFSGWTTALLAGVTLLGALLDPITALPGIAFSVIAWVELRSAGALRKFDSAAPRRLALNQIAFMLVLVAWAGWSLAGILLGPGVYNAQIASTPELAGTLQPLGELTTAIMVLFYGLVIAGSVIVQGGAALYYFTRRRQVETFIRETPAWVLATLRAAQ